MPSSTPPARARSIMALVVTTWIALYASFTLWRPALLDDADSVHAEVAREMLLRHDYVTLYANGIRYLEKAPLLYWLMAASMKAASLLGATSADAMAAAARVPLALSVLALALLCELFARQLFRNTHAGLYAALIILSSAGIFLFSRITLPDVFVCLWLTLALYAWWRSTFDGTAPRWPALFGAACALGVLSKGLIGLVFPLLIVAVHSLIVHEPWRRRPDAQPAAPRNRARFWWIAAAVFLLLAAPWHILAGIANPSAGHPAPFRFVHGHWQVPLPTDGNVRGWFWFYFMNEHLLRYLNLRVPRDYDTSPLWLFWGLCFVWIMPWSAFIVSATRWAASNAFPFPRGIRFSRLRAPQLPEDHPEYTVAPPSSLAGRRLLLTSAAVVLLFFSLSTRQEYYVLPALPAAAILLAGWLATAPANARKQRATQRALLVLLTLGAAFALATVFFLLHTRAPAPGTDLAQLLAQNPGDYALSMGHFLDLNAQALGLFRLPLVLAAVSLFGGPFVAWLLLRRAATIQPTRNQHRAVLALATGACGFLVAAHLGLQTFAPVLSSAQLARAIAPQVQPTDLIVLHGEYESGSTLGFYLRRSDLHILEGRSSNLWYGSFFPDAPRIFETPDSLRARWSGPQRIFLWQSLTDPPNQLPPLDGPAYVLARGGGKEILSNQPSR